MEKHWQQFSFVAVLILAFVLSGCSGGNGSSGPVITTIAGTGTAGYSGDTGLATGAQLMSPSGVAVDSAGNVYIADSYNNRIRKMDADGIITTIAGNGTGGYGGDNGQAIDAQLSYPLGVAVDSAGNVYIADWNNNRVRQVATNGIIMTFAGDGTPGYSGDGGPATGAQLNGPEGVAVDSTGNVYIADRNNHRVRKVATNGTIKTIAGDGTPGYSGDGGPATSAQLYRPMGVAVDSAGNVYIADYINHAIRKVATNDTITTIAGVGTAGWSGDNGPAIEAQLNYPFGVAVDSTGNVYIADQNNHRVRRISLDGIITTIAGNGTAGYGGDNGPAIYAQLNRPSGVVVDPGGKTYIADSANHRIRKVE